MIYEIPKIWLNGECFIIGGGPSVKRLKISAFNNKNIIVVNNAYKLFPNALYCVFMDKEWWDIHKNTVKSFKGQVLSVQGAFKDHPEIKYVNRGPQHGLSRDSKCLRNGGNSGYVALNLACLLGATTIYLVGFDMRVERIKDEISGKLRTIHNYHDEHSRIMPETIYSTMYIKSFESAIPDLNAMGITVINATPNSALKCFPFADPSLIEKLYEEHNLCA